MALYVSYFGEKSLTYIIVNALVDPVDFWSCLMYFLNILHSSLSTATQGENRRSEKYLDDALLLGFLVNYWPDLEFFYPIRLWISWSSMISAISEEFGSKQTNRQTFCYFRGGLSSSLFYQNLRYLGKLPLIVQSLKIFKGQYSLWFVW